MANEGPFSTSAMQPGNPLPFCFPLQKHVTPEYCILQCEFGKKDIGCFFKNLFFSTQTDPRYIEECHKHLRQRGIDHDFTIEKGWEKTVKESVLDVGLKPAGGGK
jgi:hypothetical protein